MNSSERSRRLITRILLHWPKHVYMHVVSASILGNLYFIMLYQSQIYLLLKHVYMHVVSASILGNLYFAMYSFISPKFIYY